MIVPNTPAKKRGLKTAAGIVIALTLMGSGLLYFGRNKAVTLPLTVQCTTQRPDHMILGDRPIVEVQMHGPARFIEKIKDMPLVHLVDLTAMEPGRHLVTLSAEQIDLGQGAKILHIQPTSFRVQIDIRREKTVPVIPHIVNEPVPGYFVAETTVVPSDIAVAGPATMIDHLTVVRTTPVDLSGLMEPVKKTVVLQLQDGLSVSQEKDRLVQLTIDIQEKIVEQSVVLPVKGVGHEGNVTIRPTHIHVVLRGPQKTVERMVQGHDIEISVDLKGLRPGTYTRPAIIQPPLNTTIIKAEPQIFEIVILSTL